MLNRRLEGGIPFQWHHHPEFELTLTLNSTGQRFIGNHSAGYTDGDLVLVGPNLPHTWVSGAALSEDAPHVALVIWFHPSWAEQVCDTFIEFKSIANLLARGARGLAFSQEVAREIRPMIERFFEAENQQRLTLFLEILIALERDHDAEPLANAPAEPVLTHGSRDRIDRVLTHIHTHYQRPIPLAELAQIAALSTSGLHRLFARQTGKRISDYITQMRIGEASARLLAGREPVAHIAHEVGYASLAHFNRQFKTAHGQTPRQYRARFANLTR